MTKVIINARGTGSAHFGLMYGACRLRRTIQKMVENPISSAILRGEFSEGDIIVVDAEEGEIRLRSRRSD